MATNSCLSHDYITKESESQVKHNTILLDSIDVNLNSRDLQRDESTF